MEAGPKAAPRQPEGMPEWVEILRRLEAEARMELEEGSVMSRDDLLKAGQRRNGPKKVSA